MDEQKFEKKLLEMGFLESPLEPSIPDCIRRFDRDYRLANVAVTFRPGQYGVIACFKIHREFFGNMYSDLMPPEEVLKLLKKFLKVFEIKE